MIEEDKEQKSYVVGTISIDEYGCWHCHYIGLHETAGKKYFGNGVLSNPNIAKLLITIGNRLFCAKKLYREKIEEVLSAKPKTDELAP